MAGHGRQPAAPTQHRTQISSVGHVRGDLLQVQMPKLDDRARQRRSRSGDLHQRRHPHRIRHRQPVDIPNRPHATASQHRHCPARSSHHNHPRPFMHERHALAEESNRRGLTQRMHDGHQLATTTADRAGTSARSAYRTRAAFDTVGISPPPFQRVCGLAGRALVLVEGARPASSTCQAASRVSARVLGAVTPPARIDHARRARQRCAPCAWPLHRWLST